MENGQELKNSEKQSFQCRVWISVVLASLGIIAGALFLILPPFLVKREIYLIAGNLNVTTRFRDLTNG